MSELIHLESEEVDLDAEPTVFLGEGYVSVPIYLKYEDIDYQDTPEQLENLLNLRVEIAKDELFSLVNEYKQKGANGAAEAART